MDLEEIISSMGFYKISVMLEFLILSLIIIGGICTKLTGNLNYFLELLYIVFFLAGMLAVTSFLFKKQRIKRDG